MPIKGTREQRFSDLVKIKEEIPKLLGKKINIVLTDNRPIIGELKEIKTTGIVVENMRLKKAFFAFDQISEIYFDTTV